MQVLCQTVSTFWRTYIYICSLVQEIPDDFALAVVRCIVERCPAIDYLIDIYVLKKTIRYLLCSFVFNSNTVILQSNSRSLNILNPLSTLGYHAAI